MKNKLKFLTLLGILTLCLCKSVYAATFQENELLTFNNIDKNGHYQNTGRSPRTIISPNSEFDKMINGNEIQGCIDINKGYVIIEIYASNLQTYSCNNAGNTKWLTYAFRPVSDLTKLADTNDKVEVRVPLDLPNNAGQTISLQYLTSILVPKNNNGTPLFISIEDSKLLYSKFRNRISYQIKKFKDEIDNVKFYDGDSFHELELQNKRDNFKNRLTALILKPSNSTDKNTFSKIEELLTEESIRDITAAFNDNKTNIDGFSNGALLPGLYDSFSIELNENLKTSDTDTCNKEAAAYLIALSNADFKEDIVNNKSELAEVQKLFSGDNLQIIKKYVGLGGGTQVTNMFGTVKSEVIYNDDKRSYDAPDTSFTQALSLGISASACASFADTDYISTMLSYLSDTDETMLKTSFADTSDEFIGSTMKIFYTMLKYKQPLYYSTSNSDYTKTVSMNILTFGDLVNSNDITVYSSTNTSDNKDFSLTKNFLLETLDNVVVNDFLKGDEEGENNDEQYRIDEMLYKAERLDDDEDRTKVVQAILTVDKNYQGSDDKTKYIYANKKILRNKNRIFHASKNGYKESDSVSYLNYLYLQQLKGNYTFISRITSGTILYVDAFGNIVTDNNILIFPAASNYILLQSNHKQFNNTLFQTKAFCDAFSTWTEIDTDSYNKLVDMFTYLPKNPEDAIVKENGLETKYTFPHDFQLIKNSNIPYIRIIPHKIVISNQGSGSKTITLSKDAYVTGKIASVVAYIKYFIESKQNEDLTVTIKGEEKPLSIKNVDGQAPIHRYIQNGFYTTLCVLDGFSNLHIQESTRTLLDKIPFDLGSLLIMRAVSQIKETFLNAAPSYIDANTLTNERLYINVLQIILTIIILIGFICMLFNIIKAFTFKKAVLVILLYVGSILLVANINKVTSTISSGIQNLFLGNTRDALVLESLIEAELNKRVDVDKVVPITSDSARIVVEDNNVPIKNFINSFISNDVDINLNNEIVTLNQNNPLFTSGGSTINRELLKYYININSYGKAVGVRSYVNQTTGDIIIKFTRTADTAAPNYYLPANVIMEIVTQRLTNFVRDKNKVPSSMIDNAATNMYEDEKANLTYGLVQEYLDYSKNINNAINDIGLPYEEKYDITGLYHLFSSMYNEYKSNSQDEHFLFSNTMQNMTETNRYYIGDDSYTLHESKINAWKNETGVVEAEAEKLLNSLKVFGNVDVKKIIEDYNVTDTNWGNYIDMNPDDDRIYKAIVDANKEFTRSLEYVSNLSSTTSDKTLLLFAAINASVAFNDRLGLEANQVDLTTISNDTILKLILGGKEAILFSAGKTSARYYFDNNKNVISSILILLDYILFSFVCCIKFILLYITIIVFIYSVIMNGIATYNIEGFLGGLAIYLGVNSASIAIIQLFALIAQYTMNTTLMAFILLIFSFAVIILSFTISKQFLDHALSGGFEFISGIASKLYSGFITGVSAIVDKTPLKGIMDNAKAQIEGGVNYLQQAGMQYVSGEQEHMNDILKHYNNEIRDVGLAAPDVVVDADYTIVEEQPATLPTSNISRIAPKQITDLTITRE